MIGPPTTTVARGLCVAAPIPLDISIGVGRSIATEAVISTGRSRSSAPLRMASLTPRSRVTRNSWMNASNRLRNFSGANQLG